MQLMSTKDPELNRIRALVHGASGVGKTTSLLTLPEDKTFIAVTERGALPLRKKDFKAVRIASWEDIQQFYQCMAAPDRIEDSALKEAVGKTRIIAVDSLSDLVDMCMRYIVQVERKKLVEQRTGGKTDTPDKVYEDLMTQEDWGLLRTKIRNLLAGFGQLPYHIIFTARTGLTQDQDRGGIYRTPAFPGKLAHECPAFFDLVFYMEAQPMQDGKPVPSVWRTCNDGAIIAKDTLNVLETQEVTDWTAVFRKILGNGKDGGK